MKRNGKKISRLLSNLIVSSLALSGVVMPASAMEEQVETKKIPTLDELERVLRRLPVEDQRFMLKAISVGLMRNVGRLQTGGKNIDLFETVRATIPEENVELQEKFDRISAKGFRYYSEKVKKAINAGELTWEESIRLDRALSCGLEATDNGVDGAAVLREPRAYGLDKDFNGELRIIEVKNTDASGRMRAVDDEIGKRDVAREINFLPELKLRSAPGVVYKNNKTSIEKRNK